MRASGIPLWGILVLLGAADGVVGKKNPDTVPDHSVPRNIRKFYNDIVENGSCSKPLATGFWATDPGNNSALTIFPLYSLHWL